MDKKLTVGGKLYDVSVVDQPFYNSTDVSIARNENEEFLAKRQELREEHEKQLEEEKKQEELRRKKDELLKKLG